MSTVQRLPTTYMVPPGIALPPYAESQYAWTETISIPFIADSGLFSYTTPGEYYDVVSIVFATLSTNATAGNRIPALEVTDGTGKIIFLIASQAPQTANVTGFYTWSSTTTAGYSSVDSSGNLWQVSPWPIYLMYPGQSLFLIITGVHGSENYSNPKMTITHIPSGPGDLSASTELLATPLIV